jgi:hypothetical protein
VVALLDYIFYGASKVPSRDFQNKDLRCCICWLYPDIALLKTLFYELEHYLVKKPRSLGVKNARTLSVSWRHFMEYLFCNLNGVFGAGWNNVFAIISSP